MSREITLLAGVPQEFYEVADFFRILSAAAPLTVEFYSAGREVSEAVNVSKGYAEKFDRGTFDRVRLISQSTQAVQFVTRLGNVVLYDAAPVGDTAIVSSVPLDLTANTLLNLGRPELPIANWKDGTTLALNTPVTVFAAGANPNGAILWTLEAWDFSGASLQTQAFIAKATAPVSPFDGEIIAQSHNTALSTGTTSCAVKRENPTRIGPGLGLYFISSIAGSGGCLRSCRYTLL